jgi:hypothetical protein
MTALATLALLPATDANAKSARDKAVKWLEETKTDDDPQSNRSSKEVEPLVKKIRERQNKDGGWSQSKDMPSDAWATGQALYALANAKLNADDPTIVRGREFLVKTQLADGSWQMGSRPTKPGYKGATNLIPITGAGSAWAILGLIRVQ